MSVAVRVALAMTFAVAWVRRLVPTSHGVLVPHRKDGDVAVVEWPFVSEHEAAELRFGPFDELVDAQAAMLSWAMAQ